MRNQIVSRGNHRIMVRGKGTSVSRPWFKLDFSGDNWWCPLLNILIWIAILVQIKKAISKRFSLNKWMILFQIYVNVANLIGELSIGCQYNCTPCWMKVCFNKERFEWSLKITCIFTLYTKAAEKHWYNKSRKACYHNICICQHTSTKLIAKFNHQRRKLSLTCEIWEF